MGKKAERTQERVSSAPTANGVADVEKKPTRKTKGGQSGKKAPRANVGHTRKTSGLDAAAKVLAEAGEPLSCKAIVERAFEKGYWQSSGKTPHATIYSAMLREIQAKGEQARFCKVERGRFALRTQA